MPFHRACGRNAPPPGPGLATAAILPIAPAPGAGRPPLIQTSAPCVAAMLVLALPAAFWFRRRGPVPAARFAAPPRARRERPA